MARATKRQLMTALRAIRKHYGFSAADEGGPRLVEEYQEYHGWYRTYPNVIVWEDGPFEWAVAATCGCTGCRETCGDVIAMPKGTYAEPVNGEALGLYKSF